MNTTNLNYYISKMDEKQQTMLELFLHTMQKEPPISALHSNRSVEDFNPELVSKLSHIVGNIYCSTIEETREIYQAAATLISKEHKDSDPIWNEILILTALYSLGREEGIRQERARRKAAKA